MRRARARALAGARWGVSPCAMTLLAGAMMLTSPVAGAQAITRPLPATRADSLIDLGLWSEAEEMLYTASRLRPREPFARAALGHYLARKGAIGPGIVLIEEAERFGLDSALARPLLTYWRAIRELRSNRPPAGQDSVLAVRPSADTVALFEVRVPGPAEQWVAVGPTISRARGTRPTSMIDVATLEGGIPAVDLAARRLTLHSDGRVALRAAGRRYRVLRDAAGIRVLLGPGQVLPLGPALRRMAPVWWQLDLPHGLLVVRSAGEIVGGP